MAESFIPSGRTSVVKKGDVTFQLQTEYARLPRPRVTTSVSLNGRVLHKIERDLPGELDSLERMHEAEEVIKSQHLEVARVLKETPLSKEPETDPHPIEGRIRSEEVRKLEGVERVFLVTPDGELMGDRQTTAQFRKLFKHLIRELPEMLKVFSALPGPGRRREDGIYEIEAGRILLASTGAEFYLILIKPGTPFSKLEGKLRKILFPE
ncbi:MAG: hypothetical protein GYA46_00715 [candidate division Zixibacteria bacterium]|nr:hypothetical protein [candidate division Zixibacteria bacterium]